MLASKYRLKGKKTYERIEREGKLIQSESFGLAFFPKGGNKASCFGVVVSKKISSDAALRNKIKRTIFEAVRQNWIDIKEGFDVVFLAKTTSLRKPTEELMKEAKAALITAGIAK